MIVAIHKKEVRKSAVSSSFSISIFCKYTIFEGSHRLTLRNQTRLLCWLLLACASKLLNYSKLRFLSTDVSDPSFPRERASFVVAGREREVKKTKTLLSKFLGMNRRPSWYRRGPKFCPPYPTFLRRFQVPHVQPKQVFHLRY